MTRFFGRWFFRGALGAGALCLLVATADERRNREDRRAARVRTHIGEVASS
jgi:hypothetical protein